MTTTSGTCCGFARTTRTWRTRSSSRQGSAPTGARTEWPWCLSHCWGLEALRPDPAEQTGGIASHVAADAMSDVILGHVPAQDRLLVGRPWRRDPPAQPPRLRRPGLGRGGARRRHLRLARRARPLRRGPPRAAAGLVRHPRPCRRVEREEAVVDDEWWREAAYRMDADISASRAFHLVRIDRGPGTTSHHVYAVATANASPSPGRSTPQRRSRRQRPMPSASRAPCRPAPATGSWRAPSSGAGTRGWRSRWRRRRWRRSAPLSSSPVAPPQPSPGSSSETNGRCHSRSPGCGPLQSSRVRHTDTWLVESAVKGEQFHPAYRASSCIPASLAIRSHSEGQT